jgi:hypothetical protein
MSFAVPRNLPNLASSQRSLEDTYWSSSQNSRFSTSGISISPFSAFGKKSDSQRLPMYKDKPFGPDSPPRRRSWRFYIIAVSLFGFIWWFLLLPFFTSKHTPRTPWGEKKPLDWVKGVARARIWDSRRTAVVEAMTRSWSAYEKYGWGYDEFHPNTKSGRHMVPPTGLGWIIVDALDTLMLMNLTTQVKHAREWISGTLTYDLDHDVNTFETTIRMLGGFLSAHYLQTEFPYLCPVDLSNGGEDLYLEKATDLAERLMGAFETETGIPYSSINLKTMKGIASHADGGAASLAEATTLQLEMKYLAKLTGEKDYWDKAEKVMEAVDDAHAPDGLMPIYIHPSTGQFTSDNIRLGSRGDSYYEYLIKQYYQTSEQEPIYKDLWEESLAGIKKHLITYSYPSNFTILAERPWGLEGKLEPKMDHLVCFMPGALALSTTGGLTVAEMQKRKLWTAEKQENLNLAVELMTTCQGMYEVTRTGLAPEIAFFHLPTPADGIPDLYTYDPKHKPMSDKFDPSQDADWRQDFIIKPGDAHNLQRPETVESLFYMYRITGDAKYREWGWKIFEAFMKHTEAADDAGYTSIGNVNEIPPPTRNNMESFWPVSLMERFTILKLTLDRLKHSNTSTYYSAPKISYLLTRSYSTQKLIRSLDLN